METQTPWTMRPLELYEGGTGYEIVDATGATVLENQTYYPTAPSEANAARITACVNALAGLNPDAVAGVVEALEACITEDGAHCLQHQETPGAMARRLRAINEHARAALAALRAPRVAQTQEPRP